MKTNRQILGKIFDEVCPVTSGQKFDSVRHQSDARRTQGVLFGRTM